MVLRARDLSAPASPLTLVQQDQSESSTHARLAQMASSITSLDRYEGLYIRFQDMLISNYICIFDSYSSSLLMRTFKGSVKVYFN
jgi:hypothetical protein